MTVRAVRLVAGLVFLGALFGGVPTAQQPEPESTPQVPTFRGGVDSVTVDVIVTNKRGESVKDLVKEDFDVRESGRTQAIDTFRFIETDDGRDDPAASRPILSFEDQRRELARDTNRILVIFLDDYHVRLGNSLLVRQQLAKFVSQLTPRDLVAIAMPLLSPADLTFSRNHDATATELLGFQGRKYDYRAKHPVEQRYAFEPPEVQERMRNTWTIAGLRSLCSYLGTLREGRKTVLFVSEGMTGTMPLGVSTSGPLLPPPPPIARGRGGRATTPDPLSNMQTSQMFFENAALMSELQAIFTAATRANTSVYTVDPRGLASSEFSVADSVDSSLDRRLLSDTTDMLRVIAEQTDGRAIVNRNNPLPDLQQMVRDNSAYYLLSYTSSAAPRDGKFHEIEVRVRRRDVDVRARKGYWALTEEDVARVTAPPKPVAPASITSALEELASLAESGRRNAITVWTGAFRNASDIPQVTIAWETSDTQRTAGERVNHVTVTAVSSQGPELFKGRIERDPSGVAGGQVTFDAPAGQVRIRLDAETATGRRLESSSIFVEVPDFTSPVLHVTTPVLYKGRTARDLQQVRVLASAMPVTTRAFSRTERLLIRFEAYGPAGSSPDLTMALLNSRGASIAALPAPTRTAGNDFESELSLGSFPPGDYVIEIAAAGSGNTVKKHLAIRVTG